MNVYCAGPKVLYYDSEGGSMTSMEDMAEVARISFPFAIVFNPQTQPNETMDWYIQKVRDSDVLVFRRCCSESRFTAGVGLEVETAQKMKKKIYEFHEGLLIPWKGRVVSMSRDETNEHFRMCH